MYKESYRMDRVFIPKRITWICLLSALGFMATISQVGTLLINDRVFCANQGCSVVESTLVISPLWFNGAGALYFLTLLISGMTVKLKSSRNGLLLIRLLLLCGITAEGVLVSYQAFVVQTFCSYCLFICSLIMFMNVLAGWRRALSAFLTFITIVAVFSLLQFQNPVADGATTNLDEGTCAIKHGSDPQASLYLLFSEDCPHCHKVLELLGTSNAQCEVRFNPIDEIKEGALPLEGLASIDSCNPQINRQILSLVGIKTIPVLIEKQPGAVRFIEGGDDIVEYLRQNCFAQLPLKQEIEELFFLQSLTGQDECQVDVECDGSAE